jgi:four helix bundle protein
MPKRGRNPKSEIRNPKEIRSPKSERRFGAFDDASPDDAFFCWAAAEPLSDSALILREDLERTPDRPRDLMERTAKFGEAVIRFANKIPTTPKNTRLISQLVGAATSIGANYCEADDSVSTRDFKKSIGTCRKESKEAMFFVRMVAASEETLKDEARILWKEARELNRIFGSIWRK